MNETIRIAKWVGLRLSLLVGLAGLFGCPSDGDGNGPLDDPVDVAEENIIDDLEDGDGSINEVGGRIGAWYTYNDGSSGGTQTPAENSDFMGTSGGADGSDFAANTTGSGFTEWGAGMGFDFNNPGDAKGTYDASGFAGIAFMAKGNATVFVAVATDAVTDEAYGGSCVPGEEEGQECDDAHGAYFNLTDEWQPYALVFDDVAQEGWGQAAAFDAATIVSFQIGVAEGVDFDLWFDDIGLYE